MRTIIALSILIVLPAFLFAQSTTPLTKGMIITHSVLITRANYHLNADTSLQQPLIIIDGKNITVDFNQSVLQGSNDVDEPNKFYGLAVLIKKGSENIIIKNANIHGYKIAIMADSVNYLTIDKDNFSYNYRQHLHSNLEREDISDWMSYHHNENDEWLRYGAGIYLKDSRHCVIKNNKIINGQCGLMMTRCDSNQVYDNIFSFNSGVGIGMYRSSNNKIYHNNLDFNVRGFSFGKYYRGQDSAGILVFEQCNNNVFAYNSVTHSGDGFFLWAGQYTMDTGNGGCNDNVIYGNDFSYAPTNGVEVTFSRNDIEHNIIKGCDNGVWGGYSYNTKIISNKFYGNNTAIAIEHGRDNFIADNIFDSNKTAIKLWSRKSQPADWGYAQKRDTRSVNYSIISNEFTKNKIVFDIMGTDSLQITKNKNSDNATVYKVGERTTNVDKVSSSVSHEKSLNQTESIKNLKVSVMPPQNFPMGRNQMRITEWGPYNFEYPILWLNNIDSNGVYHFDVLAKTGKWKLLTSNGFTIIEQGANNFPSTILAKADTTVQNRFIRLQYNGAAFIDAFGKFHPTNKPYTFEYQEFKPLCKWNITFYAWDSLHDPIKNFDVFTDVFKRKPLYSTTLDKLDFTWWGSIGKELPADSFATIATTTMNLPEGDYTVGITDDDLAKVYMDGKPLIDAWNANYVDLDENTHHEVVVHLKGEHYFHVLHTEIGGIATLMFYIRPKRPLHND